MKKKLIRLSVYIALSAAGIFFMIVFSPIMMPREDVLQVGAEEPLGLIGRSLKDQGIIPSLFVFKAYMRFTRNDTKVVAGDYSFAKSSSLYEVIKRLTSADYRLDQKKVVIPEGSTVADIASIIKNSYPEFDSVSFTTEASGSEGYLFPDTYDFTSTSTDDIINILRKNFEDKTKTLHEEADAQGKNWNNVVILASILEEEGQTEEDRKLISGILNKRLEAGIALQVDSTFRGINGKTTKDLSSEDLKIQSPYNTYLYPGLPPAPISNPGIESIDAALNPEYTDYLYFLTGDDGAMHYSKTFEEHIANKKKYLKAN